MVTRCSIGYIGLGSPAASRSGSLQNVALAMADARHKGADAAEKLPEEGTQARRFGKTRSAQSTALLEDYVELIADLLFGAGEARPTDIARRLGVSHATAVKTISRLKRAGLATARPYRGVFLTEKGQALADRVRVRHRLVVDLLCALGVPTESAEADAEGIEHHVSEMTLKAFAQFLKSRG
jgi:DtxR family manganese transport transcriptional regulator